ncbi:AfsR/SARP family transcriptional regulator [Nonomuraea zeae]|uniref:AfsR/SARP family transcriptional regulator n=1 Tax=Nonomuraea zeae TaxID=1642303 RepID=UPI0014780D7E|nr:AfsR/SARP family transcriptional regulator [Nonomuraea zeae]
MKVSVLGALKATYKGVDVTPSAPKLRIVLALLALRRGRVVTTGTLIEELWGANPPVSALATLQTYIYQIRRTLTAVDRCGDVVLETKPLGYVLHLDTHALDKDVFDELADRARVQLAAGETRPALELLNQALDMCAAGPLVDVDLGSVLSAQVNQVAEDILQTLEMRVEARLQLRLHRELISELKMLIAEHPFHEGFHAKLMISLQRSGRRSEALEVYQTLRRNLREELGIEPSPGLRNLQRDLLNAELAPSSESPAPAKRASFVTPAQLPPDIADFVGRDDLVKTLSTMLTDTPQNTALRLLSVTGVTGVGKTTLATRVAHRIRVHFPDGQLFADLGGSRTTASDPFDVLGAFLQAIGLDTRQLPATQEERTQLFRSRTAECKLFILLDDALSAAQVRPILPGGARCAVLVTGSNGLSSLAGARMEAETLSLDESLRMLGSIVGRSRVEAETDAARAIVRACGRLPLAIRTAGAKLGTNPKYPLRKLAERLTDRRRLLTELRFGGFDIAARLAPGYLRLDPRGRQALGLLAARQSVGLTAPQIAGLIGAQLTEAEALIEQLVELRFLRPVWSQDGQEESAFELPELVVSYVLTQSGDLS